MKRVLPIVLCTALLLSLPIPARAAAGNASQTPSAYCAEASIFPYREVFWEMEQNGLSSPLTYAAAAVFFAGLDGILSDKSASTSWATENCVLNAGENRSLSPREKMDREDLSLAIQTWLRHVKKKLPAINEEFSFKDKVKMTAQGLAAARYMQQSGVMIEDEKGYFDPSATVTVAEAEGIFLRVLGAMTDPFPGLPVSTVSESPPVDVSWFDDACFIGHSQVVGMAKYFHFQGTDYYCKTGFSAQDMLDYSGYVMHNGRLGNLAHAIASSTYNKVYIMLGVNDCSERVNRSEEFKRPMREILRLVKNAQPQATIYLISLAPVGKYKSYPTVYSPENITLYCQALKDLSREFDTEYIDLFRFMADVDGYMLDEFNSGDSLHFKTSEYPRIEEFLKCHT